MGIYIQKTQYIYVCRILRSLECFVVHILLRSLERFIYILKHIYATKYYHKRFCAIKNAPQVCIMACPRYLSLCFDVSGQWYTTIWHPRSRTRISSRGLLFFRRHLGLKTSSAKVKYTGKYNGEPNGVPFLYNVESSTTKIKKNKTK